MPYQKTTATIARNEARLQSFLNAARTIWEQKGIEALTMAQVARSAGSSVGNLYFYFPDKESLLAAVLDKGLEPHRWLMDQAMDGTGRIHHRLAKALHGGIQAFLQDPSFCRMCFGTSLPPAAETVVQDFLARRLRRFLMLRGKRAYNAPFALACWHGSIRDTLSAAAAGRLPANADVLAQWLVRWNFLALGLDKATVRKVTASLVSQ